MLDQASPQALSADVGVHCQIVNPADPRLRVERHRHIADGCSGIGILGNGQLGFRHVDVAFDVSPFPPSPVSPGDRTQTIIHVVVD